MNASTLTAARSALLRTTRTKIGVALMVFVLSSAVCSGAIIPSVVTPAFAQPHSIDTPIQMFFPGDPIDNTLCEGSHDNEYHVHDAVFVYVDGSQISLPPALGQVPLARCLYWIHTHSDSYRRGIVHIEAPLVYSLLVGDYVPPNFTLQQFVDIWAQTSPIDALPVSGNWSVYIDSQPIAGSFSTISLNPDLQGHHIVVLALHTDARSIYFPDPFTFDWGGF